MDRTLRVIIGALILVFLLFPFASLLVYAKEISLPAYTEVAGVLATTFLQAALSALFAMIAGILGGFGLLWTKRSQIFEAVALLPNVAPVLVLILAVMKLFPWAKGLEGIVFIHTLLNTGLVASAFAELARAKVSGPAELAYVEGASGPRFFFKGALPILRNDLILLFLFIFALCFSSFAVPLTIGGSRATTLEVLIYQKIRITADWSQALGLALLQVVALLVFSSLLVRSRSAAISFRTTSTPLLKWKWGLIFALLPAAVLVVGLSSGLANGYAQISALPSLVTELPILITGSFFVGFASACLTIVLLLAIAFIEPHGSFRKFLIGFSAPSSVLIGFGLLIAWRDLGVATYIKIVIAVTLITLPAFIRFRWDSVIGSLKGQISVAETLGASRVFIFRRVIFPQVIRPACTIGALSSLWAWGDFALSSVIAEKAVTLPMAVLALMSSYRFDAATVLIWVLLFGAVFTFLIFVGVGYVLGSKSQT